MKVKSLTGKALADRIGELTLETKRLNKELTALKNEFKDREVYVLTGTSWKVKAVHMVRNVLNVKWIKEDMAADWLEEYTEPKEVTNVTVEAI